MTPYRALAKSPEAVDVDRERVRFEAFFAWSRKGKGRLADENLLNRDGDGYANLSTQRHWWTWQNACGIAASGNAEEHAEQIKP